jgi:hypothetical protein
MYRTECFDSQHEADEFVQLCNGRGVKCGSPFSYAGRFWVRVYA